MGERITIAVLAWVPLALVIGYGGGWISGCDRAAVSCPDATEPIQTGLLVATLALLVLLPRVAYLAAWGAAAVMLTGLVLALPASIVGNRLPIPMPFLGAGAGLLVAVYAVGVVLAARDRPIPRPWTTPRRRLPADLPR
ncbi:MAG: hypothetical protein H0W07_10340 [Chloroflexi bacterium]|nr:hypothetical protein [Chloroflexota bacterium]